MKEITLFLLNNCPHCKLALRLQEELLEEHPAWRDIPLLHGGDRKSVV